MPGKGPEADIHPIDAKDEVREGKYLAALNVSLHAMSQPVTVLLCALEYGVSLETVEELKQTLTIAQDQCDRLQKIVLSMQAELREAITEARKIQPVA